MIDEPVGVGIDDLGGRCAKWLGIYADGVGDVVKVFVPDLPPDPATDRTNVLSFGFSHELDIGIELPQDIDAAVDGAADSQERLDVVGVDGPEPDKQKAGPTI